MRGQTESVKEREMLLAPSEIHFIRSATGHGAGLDADERTVADLSSRIQESHHLDLVPKIQVSEKNGSWFALNNSYLHVFRELERQGKCLQVRVEVVPLSKVPRTVQKGMVVVRRDREDGTNDLNDVTEGVIGNTTRGNRRGYHKLQTEVTTGPSPVGSGAEHETDGTSSYSSTDYSDNEQDEEESESEMDEALTCNVCDRAFGCTRELAQHQQKKRHFGCSVCDSVFPSLMALEQHKETLDHWSEDEGNTHESESDDDSDEAEERQGGELERLL